MHIDRIERYGPGEPGPDGTVKVAHFDLNGHRLVFSDSYVKHEFTFTPSISLFVDFTSAEELDSTFAKLAGGGRSSCRRTTTASVGASAGAVTGLACPGN